MLSPLERAAGEIGNDQGPMPSMGVPAKQRIYAQSVDGAQLLLVPFSARSSSILATRFLNSAYWHFS